MRVVPAPKANSFLQLHSGRTYDCNVQPDSEENQITVMSMQMTYDKAMFGNMDFSALSEEEKTQMTDAILAQSGFSTEIKGIKTTVDIQDTISATIEIDLKEVDPTMLSNLGIDLTNTEMNMDTIVQQMKDQGFQCK
ncbi:MAG: hypothetical protein ACLSA6_10620 [Holdemania massiliensis]